MFWAKKPNFQIFFFGGYWRNGLQHKSDFNFAQKPRDTSNTNQPPLCLTSFKKGIYFKFNFDSKTILFLKHISFQN